MDHILRPNQSAQLGGDEVGRYGHGLGIQLTEPPSLTNWDKTEIKAGMALTIEPSISYGDGLTMVAEENLLILDDGIVLLSDRAPRDLPVILFPDLKGGYAMQQSPGKLPDPNGPKIGSSSLFRTASHDETAAQLGLITLETDLTIETELRHFIGDTIGTKVGHGQKPTILHSRIACDDEVTPKI